MSLARAAPSGWCFLLPLRIDFPDGAFYGKAFHEAPVLFRRDLPGFFRGAGPLETASRGKTFVEEAGSVSFEDESLNPVCASAAEEEKGSLFKGIQAVIEAYIGGQAINPPPEIDAAAADDRALEPGPIPKHCGALP